MRPDFNHADRHWYLLGYDIRDPKRWRAVYKTLKGNGERVQYSLFRCRLNRTELEALRWELEQILDPADDLVVIHLCARCAGRIEVRGHEGDWAEPEERFRVL